MYLRLWWKDARQFWPIWIFMGLASIALQALLVTVAGEHLPQGLLGLIALIWGSIYAVVAGAAAFAGEREVDALRFLDALPASRRTIWVAKTVFALVTTLALTGLLVLAAVVFSDRWKPATPLSSADLSAAGSFILAALGWSLFWSAILNRALTAATVAICCMVLSWGLVLPELDALLGRGRASVAVIGPGQFAIAITTIVASSLIFTLAMRTRRRRIRFQSPIVITRIEPPTTVRPRLLELSRITTVLGPAPQLAGVLPHALELGGARACSRFIEAKFLAWQTFHEGRKPWCLLAGVVLGLPLICRRAGFSLDPYWLGFLSFAAASVGGVSAFELENQRRTYRFLAHHGARPRVVWFVKVALWWLGVVMIAGPLLGMARVRLSNAGVNGIHEWNLIVAAFVLFFAVAHLCGMVIQRGITAVAIAVTVTGILLIPLVWLVQYNMLPTWGVFTVPVALLLITYAWSKDWLLDRPAPARWIRLGLLTSAAFVPLFTWYVGFRAWGISDRGRIDPPQAWSRGSSTDTTADRNAAELYLQASRRLRGSPKDSQEFLERNRDLIVLLRQAAKKPDCQFQQADKLTLFDPPRLPAAQPLASLIALDAQERRDQGDLTGAWDDILTLFHMARHFSQGAGLARGAAPIFIERDGLYLALEWAVARGQTPERLRAALTTVHDLPQMPPVTEFLRAEATLIERTLDLPLDTFRDRLLQQSGESHPQDSTQQRVIWAGVALTMVPWERERARRVNRLAAARQIQLASFEPWQRHQDEGSDSQVELADTTFPLFKQLLPNMHWYIDQYDRNEVVRRALVQVFALRAWQLKHDRRFPEHLSALVPEELSSLPVDPYSGQAFGYVPAAERHVLPLDLHLQPLQGKNQAALPGSWFLYSVGPDGRNDGSVTDRMDYSRFEAREIVFAIPPVEVSTPPVSKP